MSALAVGIDLGTTNSVVAISQGGKPRVLPTPEGAELIPSVVSFHPNGQTLVGAVARARRPLDPANTVFSVKRLIGRPYGTEEVKRAASRFPFELREGPDSTVLVHTRTGDLALPEVSALVLREVRRIGETALGDRIERAVVTVPANFNELQRTATKMAGQIADLDVIRILNEPTAAALAYGYGRGSREKLAIYDFGGGTFDVTLLELNGNVFEVLATAGDTFLGGDDIDLAITEKLADEMLTAIRVDARRDVRVYESLRAAAEQAKIDLSREERVTVRLPEVGLAPNGKPLEFRATLTREEIEKLAGPLINRTAEVCAEALKLAGLRAEDFNSVILVGGSSRMPAVRARVAQFFKRDPLSTISPDTVVAMGASILAEALSGGRKNRQPAATMNQAGSAPSAAAAPTAAGVPAAAPARPRTTTQPSAGGVGSPIATAQPGDMKWGEGKDDDDASPTMTIKATDDFASALASAMRSGPSSGASASPAPTTALDDPFTSKVGSTTRPGPAIAPMPTPPPASRNAIPVGRRSASMPVAQEPPAPAPTPAPVPAALDFDFASLTSGAPIPGLGASDRESDRDKAAPGKPGHTSNSFSSPFAGSSLAMKIGFDIDLGGPGGGAPLDFGPPAAQAPTSRTGSYGTAPVPAPAPAPTPGGPTPTGRTQPGVGGGPVNPLARTAFSAEPPLGIGSLASSVAAGAAPTAAPAPAPTPRTNPGHPAMPALPPAGPSFGSTGNTGLNPAVPGRSTARGTFGGGAAPAPAPAPTGAVSGTTIPGRVTGTHAAVSAPAPAPAPTASAAPALPLLLDVTPHTLAVETVGGLCEPVIARNATIPVEQTREFATAYNDQDSVRIRIAQGEARRFDQNQTLGELVLSGITRAARGEVRIGVTFELDANGTINVRAKELATGRSTQARINLTAMPSANEVAQMAQKQRKK